MHLLPPPDVLALHHSGWILGNMIDGTQAEFDRIRFADPSLYPIRDGADEEALVRLSDILRTGFEPGVLNGNVRPGSTVAIVGAGPIGIEAWLTAQFYIPADIILVDLEENRLGFAPRFGATRTVTSADGKAWETIMRMTGRCGVDTANEAVGIGKVAARVVVDFAQDWDGDRRTLKIALPSHSAPESPTHIHMVRRQL
jgi:alcohol dehydrogenase